MVRFPSACLKKSTRTSLPGIIRERLSATLLGVESTSLAASAIGSLNGSLIALTDRAPMFEHKTDKILSRRKFMGRMAKAIAFACAILFIALTIGTLGYHFAGQFSWL